MKVACMKKSNNVSEISQTHRTLRFRSVKIERGIKTCKGPKDVFLLWQAERVLGL